MRGARAVGRFAAALAAAWLAAGCGRLAGLDDYDVGEPPVENPCGELAVPHEGRCEKVGVRSCPQGFDDDQVGGCKPTPSGWPDRPPFACAWDEDRRFPPPKNPLFGEIRYVDPGVSIVGDGLTKEHPLRSIQAAIDSSTGRLTIALANGTYPENIDIHHPVHLVGPCAENFEDPERKTRIAAPSADRPAVTIGPEADGTSLQQIGIDGGKGGIAVDGASEVQLYWLDVRGSDGDGISFEDTRGPAGGKLKSVLVDRARGNGIVTYGATLAIDNSTVRETQSLPNGDLGRGISVHPSAFADAEALQQDPDEALNACAPSHLTLSRSLVDANRDAGVFVEGSTAIITESVIRGTEPQRDGHGRGIVAERWDLGRLVATVDVSSSVVEDNADVGLRFDNACARVTNTTVRNVLGPVPPDPLDPLRSCLGNGIRARFNRPEKYAPTCPDGPPLIVSDSLIENTREAAIHVEGTTARIDRTIIRNVEAEGCTGQFGDGIAAYSYDFSPAALELSDVRVERAQRAAVASFGAAVNATYSVLADDGAAVMAQDGLGVGSSSAISASSSVCRSGRGWRRCPTSRAPVPRSLRGCGGPAEDAGAVCGLVCFSNWFSAAIQQPDKVQDVSAGDRHQDDVATAVSGDDGCAFVGGHSPGVPYTGVSFLDGYVPELGFFAAGRTPQPRADFTMLLTSSGVNIQPRLIEGKRVPNLQNAIIAAAQVCRQSPNADGVPSLACPGNGFEGAEVELEPSAGDRFYAEGGIPQRGLPSITKDSTVTFYDVPRGDYTARILAPPDATSFECSAVHDGTDSMSAWPKQGETNAFEMRVEPGKIHGIFVFCR